MESRFFEPSDNSNQKSFPSPLSDTVILVTPDFSKYPIFFRFPLRFEKFRFNCNFGMIIRLLDVRIGSVFVFNAIWVRLYNTCFRAWCTFFRAIRSPPPQFQRCPYAYGHTICTSALIFTTTTATASQQSAGLSGDIDTAKAISTCSYEHGSDLSFPQTHHRVGSTTVLY